MPSSSQVSRPGIPSSTLDSVNGTSHNPFGVKTLAILTGGAAAITVLLSLLPATGHDQMWCLYVAQHLLQGAKLYGPHLLESNPPLIMWILLLPSGAARILHLPLAFTFKLFVMATAAAVGLTSLHLLRQFRPVPSKARLWALGFAFVSIFGVVPARDFGQRDHLLVLLFLPYVLAATLDAESPDRSRVPLWLKIAIGIIAGLGISLKPHHLLGPVAIEMFLWLKRRDALPRPEPLALIATCAAYLAAIRLLTPEYLTSILPILRDTYWAIGHLTLPQLIGASIELHILAAVVISLSLVLGWRKLSLFNQFLIIAGFASTLAYYLQGTGWYYQQIPALSFFSFALCLELLDLAERPSRAKLPAWTPRAAAALAILAVGLTAYFSGYTLARPFSFPSGLSDTPDPAFFQGLPAGTPVAILTTEVDASVPLIFTRGFLWAQRENNLWTLPQFFVMSRLPRPAIPATESHQTGSPNSTASNMHGWSRTSPIGILSSSSSSAARTPLSAARSSKTGMTTCWRGFSAIPTSVPPLPITIT